jgi:hypothetical protein
MKSIKDRLTENYIIGCIKYNNNFEFYLMPIAWWILNHEKYDPNYKASEWEYVFRNNVLNVSQNKVNDFFKAIEVDKISLNELTEIIELNDKNNYDYLNFFIDFDKKEYINGFYDIEVEDYLPDETWTGKFDEPKKYLPDELQKLWAEKINV